jgi:hypothetical protein
LRLDESAHACTRSELRGASCEDWKSALKRNFYLANHMTVSLMKLDFPKSFEYSINSKHFKKLFEEI